MGTCISTALGFEGLIFSVDGFFHSLPQQPLIVFGQKRIPVGTPQDFDHIPTCAPELSFQFLNDFAVSADWAVQSLEVAVDDKNKIVQFFTGCEMDGTH